MEGIKLENSVESLEDKSLRLAIADAVDFRALYTILQKNEGLQGSQKHYSFEELTTLIGRVTNGEDPKLLTSAYGFREKVQYLISINSSK